MRVYLHIGMQKTGTTAIQKFFSSHRDELLKKYSVLYPQSSMVLDCHVLLPHCVLPMPERLKKLGVRTNIKKIKEDLLNEINTHNPEIVVISSENFSLLNRDQIHKFKELFDLPITDIICYVRRQDLFIESVYKQRMKDPYIYKKLTIQEYVSQNTWEINRLHYYTLLSYWKDAFPKARIIPKIYDRKLFPSENIIYDFLSILNIDIPNLPERIELNPSLSPLSTLVVQRIDDEFKLNVVEFSKVVNYLLKLDREEDSIIRSLFTLQERIEFLNRFKESNEKLFREYFGTENQFVLSEEEIEFYRQQDQIPREVIERAIEERYQKVLEFMRREGIMAKEKIFPKVNINYLPETDLEFFRIDTLNANLLNGRLVISGLLLPKNAEGVKLTAKDAEGVKEIQWGLPSPYFGEQRPDNPIAKNARFRADNVVPDPEKPIEIYLNNKKVVEIMIKNLETKGI